MIAYQKQLILTPETPTMNPTLPTNQHTLLAETYGISIDEEFFKDASVELQSVEDELHTYLGFLLCAKGANILIFWEVCVFNRNLDRTSLLTASSIRKI